MKNVTKRIIALTLTAMLSLSISAFADSTGSDADHANEPGMADMAHFVTKNHYVKGMFTDVPAGSWYEADVKKCYELGLMSGTGKNKFNPNGQITLAEAILMADRVHNIYNGGNGNITGSYSDWANNAAEFGLRHVLFTTDDFETYTRAAKRNELAYLFANSVPASEVVAINSIIGLPDVDSGTKYNTKILRLYRAGVLTGSDAKGSFQPDSNITRKEAAAIINRLVTPSSRKTLSFAE